MVAFSKFIDVPLFVFLSKMQMLRPSVFALGISPSAQQFGRKSVDLPVAPDAGDDIPFHSIPLYLMISPKYSTAFCFLHSGYLYVVEIRIAFVYVSDKSSQFLFIHAAVGSDGLVITLARDGRMI
jgi:hypothetical protein